MVGDFNIYLRSLENPPEAHHVTAERLYAQVELFVKLVHTNEILTIEVTILLILGRVEVALVDLVDFPEQVLLINGVTVLI